MTKDEIRQKAIKFVEEMKDECADIKCESENCAKYEDCTYLTDTLCHDAFPIWAYEHGFVDGVEEGKRMASEKQTPKKIIYDEYGRDEGYPHCPNCNETLINDFVGVKYCPECSQRLDWTGGEEE